MFVVKLRHEPMHTAAESQPIKKDKFVKFVSESREWGFCHVQKFRLFGKTVNVVDTGGGR